MMVCLVRPTPLLLLLLVTASVVVINVVVTEAKQECIDIQPGLKRLLAHAKDNDVLVKIDGKTKQQGGNEEDAFKELCERYEQSPRERIGNLIIGRINIDDNNNEKPRKGQKLLRLLNVEDENVDWPAIFIIKKGTTEADLSTTLTSTSSTPSDNVIRYDSSDSETITTSEKLAEFIQTKLNIKVGIFIYSLDFMDKLASRFVSTFLQDLEEEEASISQINIFKRYLFVYIARFASFVLYRNEARSIAAVYAKVFVKTLEQANNKDDEYESSLFYPKQQVDRIERLLEKGDMSLLKKEKMTQRRHVLEKFINPVTVSNNDNQSFYFTLILNIVLLLGILISTTLLLFGVGSSDSDSNVYELVNKIDDEDTKEKDREKEDTTSNNSDDKSTTNGSPTSSNSKSQKSDNNDNPNSGTTQEEEKKDQ